MKILMLTPYLPYPLLSGGQIRSFNLLKILAKKHEITLVSLVKHAEEEKYIKNISSFCHKVIAARRPERPWTFQNVIRTAFGKYPFLVVRNFSPEAKQAVINELKKEKFDLIHAETFYVMPHIPRTKIPVLLVEQTIEYLVYQHYVESMKIIPLQLIFNIDVHKIRYWEEYFWKQANRVIAMSAADKKTMEESVPDLGVSIVPNGVDSKFFSYQKRVVPESPKILFVGNFKWLQNREAAFMLVNKIWPIIKKSLPKANLWIVGRFPTKDILKFKSEKVEISDNIEDIRVAYERSHVLLASIYGPGGTRYKILEAMATGLPVVTTPQGIEGLGVTDGREALVRKDAKELAVATIDVLTNSKLYQQLAENANKLVRNTFNWISIARSLDQIYEDVAHERNN